MPVAPQAVVSVIELRIQQPSDELRACFQFNMIKDAPTRNEDLMARSEFGEWR
jgi:hypothetical protein